MMMVWVIVFCSTLLAQYQQTKEQTILPNRSIETFASQQRMLWNDDWQFRLASDSVWRAVNLPHDFQFEQPWTFDGGGARGFKPMCEGWYRKTFYADESWKGLRVSLDFGGIIYLGDVYLNNHKIASTEYGYVGLEADLTPYLKYGEENEVTVYASTGPKKGSRWYTGGGLFRDVYMQVQNPTHIARHGVYITTPEVSKALATVQVQVEVSGWQKRNVHIKAAIRNPQGMIIGRSESNMPVHTHQQTTEVPLPRVRLNSPDLWSPDSPSLYTADVKVYDGDLLVDSVSETFGIRKLEFSPDFGFRLNGEKIFLQGNAGHHDLGALGAACYDRAIERMMLRLKEFGYNCIRCSHNPYSDSFARIADRVGLLIVDELTDKWSDDPYWGGRQPFTAIWPQLVMEWVKRDRNRPSVILWSLGNELQIREQWTGYQGLNDWGITMYRLMDQVVKRFDTTRKTTVAQFPARAGAISHREAEYQDYTMPPELGCATEVASLNYQSDWYDTFYQHKPDLILFQSEAETSRLLAPYYNMDRERSVGMAYWGSIEYWGESNRWPKKGWNYSFFSHTLQPYPQAWLIRSAFKPQEPLVHIGVVDESGSENVSWNDVNVGRTLMTESWNHPEGSSQTVVTYTNAPSVELLANGKSLGIKQNDGIGGNRNMIQWQDVDYGKGGTLLAIARDEQGREMTRHQIETAGRAVRLVITPETSDWHADGQDLLYLNIMAVDVKGRIVPTFKDSLAITVEGPGTLLALDNGDHYTNDIFVNVSTMPMREGRMLAILRSGHETGRVKVTAKTRGMKSQKLINIE